MKTELTPSKVTRVTTIEDLSDDWQKCCRICHSTDGRLLTVCDCKGSLAFVHKKCQLQWLQVKKNNKCEICSKELNVKKVHKSFRDWITVKDNIYRLYLYMDIICALIIIPVFLWTYFIVLSCCQFIQSLATIIMLLISLFLLLAMFFLWGCVCLFHHLTAYGQWRRNQFKYVLKGTQFKAQGNGLDDDNRPTSCWRSLFWWSSNRNEANPQQMNQI